MGRPTAVFARFLPPLTSNVKRPLSPAATDRSWPTVLIHARLPYACNQPEAFRQKSAGNYAAIAALGAMLAED